MGILNVTPDSFADGGRYLDPARAVDAGLAMIAAGADLLDVGGESTRPGAAPVAGGRGARPHPAGHRRPGVKQTKLPVSVDTYKADVADAALDAGAVMVNDVSGLSGDAGMAAVVAKRRAAVVLMHNRGRSGEMYARAQYSEVVARGRGRARRVARGRRGRRRGRAPGSSSTRASASPSAPRTACAWWRAWTTRSSSTSIARSSSGRRASRSSRSPSATARLTSASGARPRRWPPASWPAPTSSASTASEAMAQVARVADAILAARTG